MRISKLAASALLAVSALGLNACVTGFPAQVSRYQAMPAPQGQSFFVVPANPAQSGGLQFTQYATIVAQAMQAQGYVPAVSPQAATMLVAVDYGVDEGRQEIDAFDSGFYGPSYSSSYNNFFRFGFGGSYGRPYYSRYGHYGYRSPFYYGWDDPFWGSSFGGARSYTVYKSYLDVDIRRRADNAALFEGHAKARSQTDNLGALVPNLIEAMFTGFPGRNGETVRITVPPPQRTR
ncbi:MAG: DUF4136 domain-containing protein [Sphingomonas bacterium]|nr:DUF4136 domain-containing protein [Sphingomonas bacterium]